MDCPLASAAYESIMSVHIVASNEKYYFLPVVACYTSVSPYAKPVILDVMEALLSKLDAKKRPWQVSKNFSALRVTFILAWYLLPQSNLKRARASTR